MTTQETEYALDDTLLEKGKSHTILAVEDDIVGMAFLESLIADLGHTIVKAHNGQEAVDILKREKQAIDIVLMDREMPIMDGITAVKHIKNDSELVDIPIVMVTGADSTQEIKEGMDAGVFYYLTKPVQHDTLNSVLIAAAKEIKQAHNLVDELHEQHTSFHLIDTCKFSFKTLDDAHTLAAFIANCFPKPGKVLAGIAELMINAVEHGNLGLGYKEKTKLVEDNTWRAEIERRQKLPEFCNKTATATFAKKEDGFYIIIQDQGVGFDWRQFLHIDPARASDSHGRGIAQARISSFDKLTYNDTGTKAMAYVSITPQLDW